MTDPAHGTARPRIGAVIIGRNEGKRLQRCLRSVSRRVCRVVYVDSGSSDGSVAFARSMGAEVVELDTARSFTMARGRNAGFARLRADADPVDFVQFVDGDCEVESGWLERASAALRAAPRAAVVCGRRRERHPEASIFNRLIDMEWERPTGVVEACGGDALMRREPLEHVGGFDEAMIAGEERELCSRLRRDGWEIHRIEAEMTRHDADMRRLGQWWRRCERTGHAYAEGAVKVAGGDDRHNTRQLRSALLWGVGVPVAFAGLAAVGIIGRSCPFVAAALCLALAYPAMVQRIARAKLRAERPMGDAVLYAVFCMLAKPAQALGAARFWWNHWRRRPSLLIEYR